MIRQGNWRLALLYAAILAVTLLGSALFMETTDCVVLDTCRERGLWLIPAGGAALLIALTLFETARRRRMLDELTAMARRIASGEYTARVLPQSNTEEADLTRAINDMSDRLRNELRLLAEKNQQLSIVFENMADGVLITDDLGRVLLINAAASRLLTYDRDKAFGRSFAEVVRHHELIDLWQSCRNDQRQAAASIEIGRQLFLQAFVTPFQENGSRGFLVILQDLTQVRFLQTVRRDFISNISHEFRTPLASIRAIVETLQDGALDEPDVARHFLNRAEGELDTLTQMVEELLELSRIESGDVPLRLSETQVWELVEKPLLRVQSQAQRAGITVVADIPDNLPPVTADAERMQRVVSNLLHNAFKFTGPGGTIRIAAFEEEEPAGQIVVLVQDSGSGIAEDELERIFERFYKSDRARTRGYGGTGLGLAISKHMVEAHGGRIWVKSKEGKGSTFFFTIPSSDNPVNQSLTEP